MKKRKVFVIFIPTVLAIVLTGLLFACQSSSGCKLSRTAFARYVPWVPLAEIQEMENLRGNSPAFGTKSATVRLTCSAKLLDVTITNATEVSLQEVRKLNESGKDGSRIWRRQINLLMELVYFANLYSDETKRMFVAFEDHTIIAAVFYESARLDKKENSVVFSIRKDYAYGDSYSNAGYFVSDELKRLSEVNAARPEDTPGPSPSNKLGKSTEKSDPHEPHEKTGPEVWPDKK